MAERTPAQYAGSITFAGREIGFTVDFGRRRNMYITVHPDLSVEVRAPRHAGLDEVLSFVDSRGAWIAGHLARFESLSPVMLDRPYRHGAQHLLHGAELRLAVRPALFSSVERVGDTLAVGCADWHDEDVVCGLVEEWFLEQALDYLPRRLDHWYGLARPILGVGYPEVRVGYMKRCWGTSSRRGWVHLNSELVKIGEACCDYVIVHELCHLRERNHDRRFYDLVARVMPDWRKHSRLLERYVIC